MTIVWFDPEDHGQLTLLDSRDALSSGCSDDGIPEAITDILAGPEQGRTDATGALKQLQELLEQIRHTPEGAARVERMNAFVRTLGQADRLAAFLELMRASLRSARPADHEITERSRASRAHCIYGWSGQSLLLASEMNSLPSTSPAGDGVEEMMGSALAEWVASIHVWQPNPEAQGFESVKRFEPNAIVEPPHSHPFSFVSYVSVGEMRQSIYEESDAPAPAGSADRYQDVELERVDGVWPPHQEYVRSRLRTTEDRLLLKQGQSYFMPPDMIHDVEVDRAAAVDRPAITFFLRAETVQVPKSYMVPSMADFHRDNPELTSRARSLTLEQWDAMLEAMARYLRGDADHLRLGEIFECGSSYAFMNV